MVMTVEQRKKKRRKRSQNPVEKKKRAKKLERFLKAVRPYGEPINMVKHPKEVEWLSTGFQELDDAISGTRYENDPSKVVPGSGRGLPRGRIVEIYGPEAAAKTSLALSVIANAQRKGLLCVFIDVEHALDRQYASSVLGVDISSVPIMEPKNGEDALNMLLTAVEEKVDVIVLDSVAALVSKAEKGGGKALGEQARMMSSVCRKITSYLDNGSGSLVIFINQIRYKIGVVFGNPEVTSGGNALKFYSSVRVEVKKKKNLKKATKVKGRPAVIGQRIRMRVEKCKLAPSYDNTCLFDVRFGKGLSVPKLRSSDE